MMMLMNLEQNLVSTKTDVGFIILYLFLEIYCQFSTSEVSNNQITLVRNTVAECNSAT